MEITDFEGLQHSNTGPNSPEYAEGSPGVTLRKSAERTSGFFTALNGVGWGQVAGRHKIVIAKEVMTELIRELPAGVNTGLVAYGHRRKGDCSDVEELAPLGPLN